MMGCMVASVANASMLASYSASDSPGSAPDGNGDTDVWTVTGFGGADRSFYQGDSYDGNVGMWAIWDRDASVDGGFSETQATHTYAGGALTVGQSVSIDYTYANIASGERVGIRLLDGITTEAEFSFLGGGDYWSHTDTASAGYTDTSMRWNGGDIIQVAFTLTGANSYSMSITAGSNPGFAQGGDNNPNPGAFLESWSGTFTGSSIDGIQVFTAGGDGSDQRFDNLSVIPEPATISLVGAFGLGALFLRRRLMR